MIQYLSHSEIDLPKWDSAIDRSLNGNFSAYSFFLDLVAPGWDALVEGDYEFVMPLPRRKKFGLSYLFNPFFVNQLGVFSGKTISPEKLALFLKAIPAGFRFIQFGLNAGNTGAEKSFEVKQKRCQYIHLKNSYPEIEKKYSENLTRNIRKATKSGMKISDQITPEQVVKIFKEGRGDMLGHFTEKDYGMLQVLLETLVSKGKGWTKGCFSPEGKLLSAAFFAFSHHRITYLKGGANEEGKGSGAMHLLMDSILKERSGQDIIFDFGGSSVLSVERFNKSFGAEDYFYSEIKRNTLPFYLRWFKK